MKLGFIGLGNMSQAIIQGFLNANYPKEKIRASARNLDKLQENTQRLGIQMCQTNQSCIQESDLVFLGVKPENLKDLHLDFKGKTIISMAAKVSLEALHKIFGKQNFIRIMPNLNVSINEGVVAYVVDDATQEITSVIEILKLLGHVYAIEENAMSSFIAMAGSAPALIYRFIDALSESDAFDKGEALNIVTQTMIGSAKYLMNSKEKPQTLIKNVSSKGGTTIEGLKVFDAYHFEEMIQKATDAIIKKDKMGLF